MHSTLSARSCCHAVAAVTTKVRPALSRPLLAARLAPLLPVRSGSSSSGFSWDALDVVVDQSPRPFPKQHNASKDDHLRGSERQRGNNAQVASRFRPRYNSTTDRPRHQATDRNSYRQPKHQANVPQSRTSRSTNKPRPDQAFREEEVRDHDYLTLPSEQQRVFTALYNAMHQKHATNALAAVRDLLPLRNHDPRLAVRLAAVIAACPYVVADQRAQWDVLLAETIDSACAAGTASNHDHPWAVPTLLVSHLARAVARRQLRSHVAPMESLHALWKANPHPDQADNPIAISKVHMAMLSMYNNVGQSAQSIDYFDQSVPVEAWSVQVLGAAATAMAAQHQQSRIRAMLTRAAEAKVIEHPFANAYLNRAFVDAFSTLESAVIALEAISAAVLPKGSASAVSEASTTLESGKRHGKLRGKDKYGRNGIGRQQQQQNVDAAPVPTTPVGSDSDPINKQVIVSLLQRCSMQVKPQLVPRILAVADRHGVPRSAEVVGWLIALKRDTYDLDGAMHLYNEYLHTSPDPVSVRMMCPVLDVLRQLGRADEIRKAHARVLELHSKRIVNMNTMYSMCAVRAVAETQGTKEAQAVWDEMAAMGVPRHPMVSGYLQMRQKGRSAGSSNPVRELDPAVATSSTLQSSEHYYLSVLTDLVNQDRIHDALKLWREMIEVKHIPPSSATMAVLLNYYVSRGDVDNMERFLALSKQLNVKATPKWTRGLLALRIKAYNHAGRHADSFRIWENALASGIVPDSGAQSLIMDACGFSNSKTKLVAIMDTLLRESWGGTNTNVWTSAVEAFCRMYDLDSALNVVNRVLPQKGLQPDLKIVGTLITVEPAVNRPLRDKRVWELVDRLGGPGAFDGVRFDEERPV